MTGPDPGSGSPLSTVGMWWTEPGPKSIPPDHIPSNLPYTASLIHDSESGETAWLHIQDLRHIDEEIVGIFNPQELLRPGGGIVRHHASQGCLYILFHISFWVKTGRQTGGRPQQPAKLPPECWRKLGSPIWQHIDGNTMQADYTEQNQLLQNQLCLEQHQVGHLAEAINNGQKDNEALWRGKACDEMNGDVEYVGGVE